ncbi:hypothetical protein QT970_23205 [Microcoleus sp. herbarium8]
MLYLLDAKDIDESAIILGKHLSIDYQLRIIQNHPDRPKKLSIAA